MELFFAFTPIFFLVVFIILHHRKKTKRFTVLIKFLKGESVFLGGMRFRFKDLKFELLEIGTGNFSSGVGGSYPLLRVESASRISFLIAPLEGKRYHFLGKYPDTTVLVENKFSITGKSHEVISLLSNASDIWRPLLSKPSAALNLKPRYFLTTSGLRKIHVCEYTGLEKNIFSSPEDLTIVLERIAVLLSKLGTLTYQTTRT